MKKFSLFFHFASRHTSAFVNVAVLQCMRRPSALEKEVLLCDEKTREFQWNALRTHSENGGEYEWNEIIAKMSVVVFIARSRVVCKETAKTKSNG